jgi:predicted PhzF superfamily epimerase YddE/YHI9
MKRDIVEETVKGDLAFECRQFPRFSGYSEDPATGIAAGALAASFRKRQLMCPSGESGGNSNYDIHQGTAMGRPSKIIVKICNYPSEETNPNPPMKVIYTGAVAVDSVSFLNLAQET